MKELFLKLSNTQCRELRSSSTDLYIPRLRTTMGQKSFGYRGVHFWNNLIDEAKEAKTYFSFKRILSKRSNKFKSKVCWYYRTLVQHEKAATFLDTLKSFFSSDTRQSMKRRITTKRLFAIYIARCGYTWLDESKWPQEWPISPITIIT